MCKAVVPVRVAITTRRLLCERCGHDIQVPLDCVDLPCPFCAAEAGGCTGDAGATALIRRHYDGLTAFERLRFPNARTLLAYTSEGYLVTYEGAPYWMHVTVIDGGTVMQRLEAWREEHQQPADDEDWTPRY